MDELESGFEETSGWQAAFRERYAGRGFLELTYEGLVENMGAEYSRLTGYLGVEYQTPTTTLARQNPQPLSALIVNYRELDEAFAGTQWHSFFREDAPTT